MDRQNKRHQKLNRKISAEQWVLLIGLLGFLAFLWIIAFLFIPLLSGRPVPVPQVIVDAAATQGFILPPTWTPGPTPEIVPTRQATGVYNGVQPTRIYTPRATSIPGIPMPEIPLREDIIDLARIMQGESAFDLEAARHVGWVAKNRWNHSGYGNTYATVSHGFFGYRADLQPKKEFIKMAQRVIREKDDPTGGCLFALSRTDIAKLGISPSRANVTSGEWFFFLTWPVSRPY